MVVFCLKTDAKYEGKSTVIQQGAKRAATPAKNEAINDALISRSIINYTSGESQLLRQPADQPATPEVDFFN